MTGDAGPEARRREAAELVQRRRGARLTVKQLAKRAGVPAESVLLLEFGRLHEVPLIDYLSVLRTLREVAAEDYCEAVLS